MISDKLKRSILFDAFQGKLSSTKDSDTPVKQTLSEISIEKENYLSKHGNIKKNKIEEISGDEIPFEIPKTWEWVRWGNLSYSIQYGANAGALSSGNVKLVRISDIQNNKVIWENVPYSQIKDKDIEQYLLSENDILFARTGGTVGKSVVVKDLPKDAKYVFAGYLIRSNYSPKVNYRYLKYFMESPLYWNQLKQGTIGSAQPNCNGQTLSKMIIPFPPVEEQQRIVNEVDSLFEKLDEINPIEEDLFQLKSKFPSSMRKSIINYAIKGKMSEDNSSFNIFDIIPEDKFSINSSKFNLSIIENEIPFEIPKNWKWVKLGNLVSYQNGYSYKPNESNKSKNGMPIIKSQNLMTLKVVINDKTCFVSKPNEKMLRSKINKGDLLMCLSSQSSNPEPLGKTAIYEDDEPALLNQRVLKLTPYNAIYTKYLFYVINSQYFHYAVSHKGSGSAQSNLKLEHVMEMYIPFPPVEEQQRIVEKLDLLVPMCNDIEKLTNE